MANPDMKHAQNSGMTLSTLRSHLCRSHPSHRLFKVHLMRMQLCCEPRMGVRWGQGPGCGTPPPHQCHIDVSVSKGKELVNSTWQIGWGFRRGDGMGLYVGSIGMRRLGRGVLGPAIYRDNLML